MTTVECKRPVWATIEEGGDYIPWPEFDHEYSRIHSVGFDDGAVFDTSLVNNPRALPECKGGWRYWSSNHVPESLLLRMGLQKRVETMVPEKKGFWKRLFGRSAPSEDDYLAQMVSQQQAAAQQQRAYSYLSSPLARTDSLITRGRRTVETTRTEDTSSSVLPYMALGYWVGSSGHSTPSEPSTPSYSGGGGDFGGGGSSSSWSSDSSSSSSYDSGSSSSSDGGGGGGGGGD